MKIYDIPFIGPIAGLFRHEDILTDLEKLAKKLKPVVSVQNINNLVRDTKDAEYVDCPDEYVKQFYEIYKKYRPRYESEVWDCDNFALDLMAFFYRMVNMIEGQSKSMALGICTGYFEWNGGTVHHAVNFFINNGERFLLEPQSGIVYNQSKAVKITSYYI